MNLRELRAEKNATQDEIAKQLGVKRYTYAKWEQGRAEPSIIDLINLSKIYNCSIDYIVGNSDDFDIISTSKNLNLTSNESEMLSHFRLLSADLQREAIGFVKALAI